MNEPMPEAATDEGMEIPTASNFRWEPHVKRSVMLGLVGNAGNLRNQIEQLLDSDQIQADFEDFTEALDTLSDKLYRTALAALAKVG